MLVAQQDGAPAKATHLAHRSFTCVCPACEGPVQAKCGQQKIWHWAHRKDANCAHGKGETEWHRSWKTLFDVMELEVCIPAWPNNRADICTLLSDNTPLVIELQHSPIDQATIEAREAAYQRMVWVVDVSHRDFSTWNRGRTYFNWSYASRVWEAARYPVIFDTGSELVYWNKADERCRLNERCDAVAHARVMERDAFLEVMVLSLTQQIKTRRLAAEREKRQSFQALQNFRNTITIANKHDPFSPLQLNMMRPSERHLAFQLIGEAAACALWKSHLIMTSEADFTPEELDDHLVRLGLKKERT